VFFLILESLGSTELVFILVMALVFFGPRKLPQISRSLGKNLAEFRRASEDFKRTWDREVSFEEGPVATNPTPLDQSTILNPEMTGRPLPAPSVASVSPDQVVARHADGNEFHSSNEPDPVAGQSGLDGDAYEPGHSPKNDWL
jgi:TatA/E family protein of Tat protein translocase